MPKYAYELIADTIRERIADGTYPAGSRLPSRSQLCAEFGVSVITVGWAMRILRGEGLTEVLPGVGVYVKER
jgi:DNA-binding GntR family transcriptional regulator